VDQIADELNRTPRAVKECAGRLKRAGVKKYGKHKYWVPEERSYVLDTYKDKYPRQIGELIDDLNRSESSIQQEYRKLRNDKEYIDKLLAQKNTPQKTKDITNANSFDRVTTPIDKKQEEYDDIEEFANL
jgi:Mn-dependent DtxR family transcriptional regulator